MATRDELIESIKELQRRKDSGEDAAGLLQQLNAEVSFPQIADLLNADYGPEYIADRARLYRRLQPGELSDAELASLIVKIRTVAGSEAEVDNAMDLLEQALPHPQLQELIGDWSKQPEQVIELAKNYPAVRL